MQTIHQAALAAKHLLTCPQVHGVELFGSIARKGIGNDADLILIVPDTIAARYTDIKRRWATREYLAGRFFYLTSVDYEIDKSNWIPRGYRGPSDFTPEELNPGLYDPPRRKPEIREKAPRPTPPPELPRQEKSNNVGKEKLPPDEAEKDPTFDIRLFNIRIKVYLMEQTEELLRETFGPTAELLIQKLRREDIAPLDIICLPPEWKERVNMLQRLRPHRDPKFMHNVAHDAIAFDPKSQQFIRH
ncbi:MAG TPA: hypothetical protein VD928_00990 [Candidatus Paceibacterota bacterium]|nr:hypothetical protein [Candidatus Paceibacterota bacterium]